MPPTSAKISTTMDETDAIQQSWQQAASDLGIEVETLGDAVLVANFGSPSGMICALRRTRDGWEELRRTAESREAGWSALGHSFLQYDREVFIEALCDWGWCGDGAPPAWYRDANP